MFPLSFKLNEDLMLSRCLVKSTSCWHTCEKIYKWSTGRRSGDGKKRDGALSEAHLTCNFDIV